MPGSTLYRKNKQDEYIIQWYLNNVFMTFKHYPPESIF